MSRSLAVTGQRDFVTALRGGNNIRRVTLRAANLASTLRTVGRSETVTAIIRPTYRT